MQHQYQPLLLEQLGVSLLFEKYVQVEQALGLVEESLGLSLLATPGGQRRTGKELGNQTLGLYTATKYSPESQKTAILRAEFLACCEALRGQNCP
jgi:hypothetical protein